MWIFRALRSLFGGRARGPRLVEPVGEATPDQQDPQQQEQAAYEQWTPGNSSWIAGLRFSRVGANVGIGQMMVRQGKVYTFAGMDFQTFREWITAASWGTYFNYALRGQYSAG